MHEQTSAARRGALTKIIFERNPDREFYIAQSAPIEWMFPLLSPNGLIMKINRQPLPDLSPSTVKQDHQYWTRYASRLIGNWLNYDTTAAQVCQFVRRVHLQQDLNGFKGDRKFLGVNRSNCAQLEYSVLRTAIAKVYAWRYEHAATHAEQVRMSKEADFAFRKAFALCHWPSDAPWRMDAAVSYANFLINERRFADAQLILAAAREFASDHVEIARLLDQIRK
jgi:hypothetical protein